MQPEEELILLAADVQPDSSILERMNALIPTLSRWEVFTKMAIDRAAAPLLVDKLPELSHASLFPENVVRSLKQASLRTLTRNMLLTEHFRQVVLAFDEAGIPVVALKGVMLSEWLYGNINLRQFSDLDLLVPTEKGLAAVDILKRMGYVSNSLSLSEFVVENTGLVHYKPMIKNGVSVEIHIRLHSKNEHYEIDLPGLWQRAVPIRLHGVTALCLSPEDLLLHLCVHLDKHFRSGEFQFTCLYDIVNMLNHKGADLNWALFEQQCIKANAVSETFKYLVLAKKYVHGDLPDTLFKKYGHLLKSKDVRMLLGILRGKSSKSYSVSILRALENMNSMSKSIRYVFDILFPSADFMMKRYRLHQKSQLWLYYPYRQLTAFRSIWQILKKTLK